MKKFTLIFTSAFIPIAVLIAYALFSPSRTIAYDNLQIIAIEQELPTIDMVATHAIDLEMSVGQLTFVPNSVAPWLGRIILLDDAGRLYSTDIEGRDPKPVGSGKYIDIYGLAREAAPGVFLAINVNNQIEAFIESSDDGNFSPMIYSGESIDANGFCLSADQSEKSARVLTPTNNVHNVSMDIDDKMIAQKIVSTVKTSEKSNTCAINPNDGNRVTIKNGDAGGYLFDPTRGSEMTVLALTPLENSPDGALKEGKRHKLSVKNGLSVRGVEQIKHIAATPSNYGGGAYADGVLALVDADENRIVFISLGYARRQLLKTVNPPEDPPQ